MTGDILKNIHRYESGYCVFCGKRDPQYLFEDGTDVEQYEQYIEKE